MGLRYQKRIRIAPGVYVCVSLGGVSLTVGNRMFKINFGQRGIGLTGSAPGTGVSYRQTMPWPARLKTALRHPTKKTRTPGLTDISKMAAKKARAKKLQKGGQSEMRKWIRNYKKTLIWARFLFAGLGFASLIAALARGGRGQPLAEMASQLKQFLYGLKHDKGGGI